MLNYNKIMVPVDFSQISHSAITRAARHSEASNSKLLVVHVVDDVAVSETDTERRVVEVENKLETLLDTLEIGYCERLVTTGDTIDVLLQLIREQHIDLVVMGTHSGVALSPLMRSVSMDVVAHTECDVLVLHK